MVKKPDIEEIYDLLDQPDDGFIQSILNAEGIVSDKKINKDHKNAAKYIWKKFLEHERQLWYPGNQSHIKVWNELNLNFPNTDLNQNTTKDFQKESIQKNTVEFPSRDSHNKLTSQKFIWLGRVAILLVGLTIGMFGLHTYQSYLNRSYKIIRKPILSAVVSKNTEWIVAPAFIKMKRGILDMDNGSMIMANHSADANSASYEIISNHLQASFLLNKTNLLINHPIIKIKVTGTDFSVDLHDKDGTVMLEQGSLEVMYYPENSLPQKLKITGPHRLMFDKDQMLSQNLKHSRKNKISSLHSKMFSKIDLRNQNSKNQNSDNKNNHSSNDLDSRKNLYKNNQTKTKSINQNEPAALLHRFTLKNGKKYYGYIVKRDTDTMLIEQKNGRRLRISLDRLFIVDVLQ